MPPAEAKEFWNTFIAEAKSAYKADMVFGAFGKLHIMGKTHFLQPFCKL
jgi:hypothetical protein